VAASSGYGEADEIGYLLEARPTCAF